MAGYNFFTPAPYGNPYLPSIYPQAPQPIQAMPIQGQQQPAPAAPQATGILWVASEAEAQAFPVAPNNAVALWDSNRPTIYLKQADASGKPVIKTYDLTERTETARVAFSTAGNTETPAKDQKDEIDALWAAVEEIRQKVDGPKRGNRKREVNDDDAE